MSDLVAFGFFHFNTTNHLTTTQQTTVELYKFSKAGISQFGAFPTVLITGLIAVFIFFTLTGNILVCLAVFLVRKLREQPANYLLVSLAVSDFFVGLVVMPLAYIHLYHGRWDLGDALCYVWTSADVTLCTASILNLCAISVDRYLAITRPFSYGTFKRTNKRMLVYIGLVWILALLISVVPLIAVRSRRPKGVCQVSQNIFYQIYATLGSFYVPTAIMICVNFKILGAVKRLAQSDRETTVGVNYHAESPVGTPNGSANSSPETVVPVRTETEQGCRPAPSSKSYSVNIPLLQRFTRAFEIRQILRGGSHDSHSHQNHVLSGESKALKTLSVIMGAFIFCWLPFFIMALIKAFCGSGKCGIPWWLDALALWLGYINSMLNPMIYCKYNRDFRVPFREMICCRFKTLQTVLRTEMFVEKFGEPTPHSTDVRNSATVVANHSVSFDHINPPTVIMNDTSL